MRRGPRSPLTLREQLNLPITSFAVGAVAFRFIESSRRGHPENPGEKLPFVELLNMDYTDHERKDRKTVRFPMGKGDPGETFRQTVYREFKEEIAAEGTPFNIEVFSFSPLYARLVRDDHSWDEVHLKAFLAVGVRGVTIRDYTRQETEGGRETQSPLRWTEARALITQGHDGIPMHDNHREVAIELLEFLSSNLPEVRLGYEDFLIDLGFRDEIPEKLDPRVDRRIARFIAQDAPHI